MPEQSFMRRTVPALVLALLAALSLTACGSAGSDSAASSANAGASTAASASTATSTSSTTAASATTTSTTTTITTTTTTTPTSAGPAPCVAAGLSLSFLGQQGGMGHGEIGFELHNTSGDSCRTYGYPGILFLDQQGHPLPTIPHHTTRDFFGSTPAAPLVIAPGASASFRLDVGHGVATASGCATAYALQVIPPNDTATLHATIPNGSYECKDANVSPLRPGTSAYP